MLLVMDISKSSYTWSSSERKQGAVRRVYSSFGDCEEVVEKEGILGMKVADSVAQDFQGL